MSSRAAIVAWVAVRKAILAVTGVAMITAIWWLISANTVSVRVPSPLEVAKAIRVDFTNIPALSYVLFQSGGIFQNLLYTFENVVIGVAIGTGLGLMVGVLIARVRIAREIIEPPLLIGGTVPVLILLPFLTTWFGTSRLAQNGLVIFYAALTVAIVSQQATRNVSGRFAEYAASLGAGRRQLMFTVVLPAIIPELLGAIRVSLAAGWGFETIAEVLGARHGVGRIIQVFGTISATTDILAVVICVGIAAVIVDALVTVSGRWIVRWQE